MNYCGQHLQAIPKKLKNKKNGAMRPWRAFILTACHIGLLLQLLEEAKPLAIRSKTEQRDPVIHLEPPAHSSYGLTKYLQPC